MCAGGCFFFTERRGRGRKEVAETSGGGGQVKEVERLLAFQPVSHWLATCLRLRGDLWPGGWRALVAASALIREPHDSTLCRASDPPLQTLRLRAQGTTDTRGEIIHFPQSNTSNISMSDLQFCFTRGLCPRNQMMLDKKHKKPLAPR